MLAIANGEMKHRHTTTIQDKRVIDLLTKGSTRKAVASRLGLSYWQVSLSVYRSRAAGKCPGRV